MTSLHPAALKYTYTTSHRAVPAGNDPIRNAGSYCTDHMITAKWRAETGWDVPELVPYGDLRISPIASVLHYATECFEGMKAFRGYDGKLRLFRPGCNTRRMLISAKRVSLPAFDPDDLEKLIYSLLEVDGQKFLPSSEFGKFIYLRPTIIGTHCGLGVSEPTEAMLFIVATYMPELSELKNGIRLYASEKDEVRAWPGGHGFAKVGANYGPTLKALGEAKSLGYDQVLWLFGSEGQVTECGGSNFFVLWRTRQGSLRLQTAPLEDKLILDGIVRRSILELARARLGDQEDPELQAEIVEEPFTMNEIDEAVNEGRVVEAFTCGTAYFVTAISAINYKGTNITIPMSNGNSGKITALFKQWLGDIFFGREDHTWAPIVDHR